MSTRQFAPVNPGLWEGLDALLGTNLAESAHRFNISYNPRFDKDAIMAIEVVERPPIGTTKFETEKFVSDVGDIASAFGASQDMLDMLIGSNEDERFQKALDLLDFVLSGVKMIPIDKMDDAKDAIRRMAMAMGRYTPNATTIAKLLNLAPGMKKYSKAINGFAENIDHVISILNVGDDGCFSKAVDAFRDAIKSLRDIKISDVNTQAKRIESEKSKIDTGKVIDMEEVKEEKVVNKTDPKKSEKKKEEKKEETPIITGTDENVAASAAAMSKQMMPDMNPEFIPDQEGSLPEFMQDTSVNKHSGSVPDYMAQNVQVPRVDARERIFAPVNQPPVNTMDNRLAGYSFINDIQAIANSVGIYTVPELIVDVADNPMLIFIRAFNNQAYLPDKSFIIDLGKVIDNRFGIWPCAAPNGAFNVLESCEQVYRLFENDKTTTKVNKEFLTALFQYGFSNMGDNIKNDKKNLLYGLRMTSTNQVIALITMPDTMHLDSKSRNIIKGACIRMAPEFVKAGYNKDGRLKFSYVNKETLEFGLTNEGMSHYFMTQAYPHQTLSLTLKPALDEEGKYIPAGNKEGGTDIKFDVFVNHTN